MVNLRSLAVHGAQISLPPMAPLERLEMLSLKGKGGLVVGSRSTLHLYGAVWLGISEPLIPSVHESGFIVTWFVSKDQ